MKKIINIFLLMSFYFLSFSQETGTYMDPRDDKVYKTVKIGDQWIMTENLAYKPNSGNYWAYNNDQSNVAKYGYLYDWQTSKKVSPTGWHLPTKGEWDSLIIYLGDSSNVVCEKLLPSGNSGFKAQFGGIYFPSPIEKFYSLNEVVAIWSSTYVSGNQAYRLQLSPKAVNPNDKLILWGWPCDCGLSVRLFRDK
jgi:uncharacterized protein (TIGR02145 family)